MWRQRLLGGLSHILVDEYQDIDTTAYRFVSLLAGKSARESENRLKILAVGDDDQSIYQFAGANVEYIRRFQEDYLDDSNPKFPKPVSIHHMVENYRSTKNIIAAGNAIIANNEDRMKTAHPIKIDALRTHDAGGGVLEELDPLTQGKIQVLVAGNRLQQAYACIEEVQRYMGLSERHEPEHCCIVARTNAELIPIRIAMEKAGIPCSIVGSDTVPNLTRVREIYDWLEVLKSKKGKLWSGEKLLKTLRKHLGEAFLATPIGRIVEQIGGEFYGEVGETEMLCEDIVDYFYDALFEQKRRGFAGSGVILSTAHKVKGLEFDNVIILDGSWADNLKSVDELEEARRLYYVAVTRARRSLTLLQLKASTNRFISEIPAAVTFKRSVEPNIQDPQLL
ncbi:MAG: 3'-5' exonuclease, partial [Coraliomargarita sp.]